MEMGGGAIWQPVQVFTVWTRHPSEENLDPQTSIDGTGNNVGMQT